MTHTRATLPPHPDDPRARARFVGLFHTRGFYPREAEALWHVMRGVTNGAEVATAMGISLSLAKNYHTRAINWARERYPYATLVAAVMLAWGAYRWSWGTEEDYHGHLHPIPTKRTRELRGRTKEYRSRARPADYRGGALGGPAWVVAPGARRDAR